MSDKTGEWLDKKLVVPDVMKEKNQGTQGNEVGGYLQGYIFMLSPVPKTENKTKLLKCILNTVS